MEERKLGIVSSIQQQHRNRPFPMCVPRSINTHQTGAKPSQSVETHRMFIHGTRWATPFPTDLHGTSEMWCDFHHSTIHFYHTWSWAIRMSGEWQIHFRNSTKRSGKHDSQTMTSVSLSRLTNVLNAAWPSTNRWKRPVTVPAHGRHRRWWREMQQWVYILLQQWKSIYRFTEESW